MNLSIETNFPQIDRALAALPEQVGRQALARALNRAVDQARVQMQRNIAREFNVSVGYVRARMRVHRAYARGQVNITAELSAGDGRKRSANIIAFVERKVTLAEAKRRSKAGTLNQLRVQVRRGQVRPLPGAFIGNKGRTVFRRVGRARLPIEPVQTIDVGQMFNTRRINAAVVRTIQQRLPDLFAREAVFYLDRFNKA